MPRKPSSKKPAAAAPAKSELFAAGEIESVVPELSAVKVIDDRGNDLLVTKEFGK